MGTPTQNKPEQEEVAEARKGTTQETSPSGDTARWNAATRVAFRFCFAYFTLFWLKNPYVLDAIPKVEIPDLATVWPMREITLWTAAHVFHLAAYLHPTGAGDTAFEWVQAWCMLVTATVVTVVWSLLDWRRRNYVTVHTWLNVIVRFALAEAMFYYGFIKIIPMQMNFPPLERLVEPWGNFSPMGVLWSSIGAVPAYERAVGGAEVLGGLLLIFPSTKTLGSLVCLADLTEVFLLNMTYDVPAKLFSFHLLLLAVFLLAPEFRRLINFFITDRATARSTQLGLFRSARANRAALAMQLLVGAYLLGTNYYGARQAWRAPGGPGGPKPALYGIWDVEQMTIDGQVHPPLLTDTERWRRMIVCDFGAGDVAFQRMDETFLYFVSSTSPTGLLLRDAGPLAWARYAGDRKRSGEFRVARPVPDELILDGSMDGHNIHAELKRFDLTQFTLVNRGFHWINEDPFQH